jgi:hypothetical protein
MPKFSRGFFVLAKHDDRARSHVLLLTYNRRNPFKASVDVTDDVEWSGIRSSICLERHALDLDLIDLVRR